jgi:hypothetical protein
LLSSGCERFLQDICLLETLNGHQFPLLTYPAVAACCPDRLVAKQTFILSLRKDTPLTYFFSIQEAKPSGVRSGMLSFSGAYFEDGDSGSPLIVVRGNPPTPYVIGVHSFVHDNTQPVPAVGKKRLSSQSPSSSSKKSRSTASAVSSIEVDVNAAIEVIARNQHGHSAYHVCHAIEAADLMVTVLSQAGVNCVQLPN